MDNEDIMWHSFDPLTLDLTSIKRWFLLDSVNRQGEYRAVSILLFTEYARLAKIPF
jgi:hypothetical protein